MDGGTEDGGAALVAPLAAGVSAAFSFFSLASGRARHRHVRPYVRPSALARPPDRRLLPSTLVTRARAEQKHLREFFSQMCRYIYELDGIGTALSPPQFQGTERVCSALEQLL